jgi:hypothetical protein
VRGTRTKAPAEMNCIIETKGVIHFRIPEDTNSCVSSLETRAFILRVRECYGHRCSAGLLTRSAYYIVKWVARNY